MRRTVTLYAADLERAVFGLAATSDDGAALLAQLEALLPESALPRPLRPQLSADAVADALAASKGSVKAAAKRLGYARSTVREVARRSGVRP